MGKPEDPTLLCSSIFVSVIIFYPNITKCKSILFYFNFLYPFYNEYICYSLCIKALQKSILIINTTDFDLYICSVIYNLTN